MSEARTSRVPHVRMSTSTCALAGPFDVVMIWSPCHSLPMRRHVIASVVALARGETSARVRKYGGSV